jgi:hypothetical protein
MPSRKRRRHSRTVRDAAKSFSRFADRLASLISSHVAAALEAAIEETKKAEARVVEPREEPAPPPRRVRRRYRRREVPPTPVPVVVAPKVLRRPARPPVLQTEPTVGQAPVTDQPPVGSAPDPMHEATPASIEETGQAPSAEPAEDRKHSVTKPPDRMTRMRDSFRPGKVAVFSDEPHVVLDAPEDDPPGDR